MNNMRFVRVADNPSLVRDVQSGAIINVDDTAYMEYKKRKRELQNQHQKEALTLERINKLEKDVQELKDGINQILKILTHVNS